MGIPIPALCASLSYFDSYRNAQLPQNLTQAQRDYFGAHSYQRADRPTAGFVHTDWTGLSTKTPRSNGGKK
jgi:6-phosphogluconate dehydrogenase